MDKKKAIKWYAEVYKVSAKQAAKIIKAKEKERSILGPLANAKCSKDVKHVYVKYSEFFFKLADSDPKTSKLLGHDMAAEMFILSRTMYANRKCIAPENLSLAIWIIAHRKKPVKKGNRYETTTDVAKRLDNRRKKVNE
jgi:hypothetical protein